MKSASSMRSLDRGSDPSQSQKFAESCKSIFSHEQNYLKYQILQSNYFGLLYVYFVEIYRFCY